MADFHRIDTGIEVYQAAHDALRWGFPRELHPIEYSDATWFRGPGLVFWFEQYPTSPTCFVHVAVDPERRPARWPVRAWLRFIDRYGESVGATELGFVGGPEFSEAAGYLSRLGWEPTPYGLARPLSSHAEAA